MPYSAQTLKRKKRNPPANRQKSVCIQLAPDFMPKMRQELLEVLKKYLPIADEDDVEFNFARKENTDIMEMSVSLEKADEKTALKIDSKEDALK